MALLGRPEITAGTLVSWLDHRCRCSIIRSQQEARQGAKIVRALLWIAFGITGIVVMMGMVAILVRSPRSRVGTVRKRSRRKQEADSK